KGLLQALRNHQLHPIGVVAEGQTLSDAKAAGLTSVDLSSAPTRPVSVPAPDKDVPVVAPPADNKKAAPVATKPTSNNSDADGHTLPAIAPAAMVINRQLRSGQRVYARDTDLIIIGVVSQGAEV